MECFFLIVGFSLSIDGFPGAAPQGDIAKHIRQWVTDLDHDDFRTREAASSKLQAAGKEAFAALAAAAAGPSAEVTRRAVAILRDAAAATDPAIAKAAKDALLSLIHSPNKAAAHRATGILARDCEQILLLLQHAGVTILRDGGDFSGLRLADGWQARQPLLVLRHFSDLQSLPADHPDVLALSSHVARVTELNLYGTSLTDEGVKLFKHFPNLKRVPMGHTKITDATLAQLKARKTLEYIGVRGNNITDAGVAHLRDSTNLTGLHIGETKVTDAGLAHLQALTRLEMLMVFKTAITDRGLDQLHGLTRLRTLDVSGTKVTPEGIARLREKAKELKLMER